VSQDGINSAIFETIDPNNAFNIFFVASAGATIEIDNDSVKEVDGKQITNYTVANRVVRQPKGLQSTCLELDSVGIPVAYREDILVKNDNQNLVLPLSTPIDFIPIKDIKKVEVNSTTLTITHTDKTTVIKP